MDANITVLKDESLGGVQREYREVKRKARVGERIKVTAGRSAMLGEDFEGGVFSVISTDNYHAYTDGKWADGSTLNPSDDDYVVLEPTDIVRVNGERLRMVDRKAAVGERIIITNAVEDSRKLYGYDNGQIYEIKEYTGDGPDIWPNGTKDSALFLFREEYRVLEPVEPPQSLTERSFSDQAAATIGALQAQIKALESRVSTLEQAQATAAKVDDEPRAKSAQEIRDAVIERAKADVKDLRKFADTPIPNEPQGITFWPESNETISYIPIQKVEYVINRDKRKVTVIIRSIREGTVYAVGRAKCAPNDVFNAHIGRAIALRRALGLEVLGDYVSCPNPEEPRVGDVVYTASEFGNLTISDKVNLRAGTVSLEAYAMLREDKEYGMPRIIDDSREEVAE